ncbi:MAG: monovalent cation/H+ antiporter subunit D family protein [Magnetovibrionaceae bacterium]
MSTATDHAMTLADHLPALQVVIPLLAAPIAVILRNRDACWALSVAVSWVSFGIALSLMGIVLDKGTLIYEMGGWAPPWGIEYHIDAANAFLLVIITAIGALVAPYAKASVEAEVPENRGYLFYTMYLLCFTGLLGMAATGDAFNLFVFLEISSLSTYVLISLGKDRRSLTASYRYLIMGTIGATFYIIGVGLLYMATGSLNMYDLAGFMADVADSRTVLAAMAFLTVGLALKLALFPVHVWLPNAYAFAPSVVTAFLAATATKVAIYALIRIDFSVFAAVNPLADSLVDGAIMALAICAMFYGSVVAIYQNNLKRLLAYSSVAQVGYIILGLALNSDLGLTAALIHVFNHAIMKGALFLVLGGVALKLGGVTLDKLIGAGKRMPVTMACFLGGGLSLIGVPLTVGFVSKWYLVQAAFDQGHWWIAVLIMLSSLLAVIYVWRVVEIAYFKPLPEGAKPWDSEMPASMLVPTIILTGACIWFGIDAGLTLEIATTATQTLMGGAAQ